MTSSKEKYSFLYIIIAGILWGLISIFVKSLTKAGLSSLEIVEIRACFSSVILVIICLMKQPSLLKIRLRDIPLFLGTGIVSIVLFNACYFTTINMSGASTAALLLYTAPAMVMVISIPVLKETFTGVKAIALILTIAGLIFVTGILSSGEHLSGSALLFGLGSGFGYAMYSIFGKFLVDKYHALTITTNTFVVAALGLLPFMKLSHLTTVMADMRMVGIGVGIAALCTVLPFLCYTKGLQKVDTGRASILATVEPLVATVTGVVLFHEKMTLEKIIGIVLILLAIVVLNSRKNPGKNTKEFQNL